MPLADQIIVLAGPIVNLVMLDAGLVCGPFRRFDEQVKGVCYRAVRTELACW